MPFDPLTIPAAVLVDALCWKETGWSLADIRQVLDRIAQLRPHTWVMEEWRQLGTAWGEADFRAGLQQLAEVFPVVWPETPCSSQQHAFVRSTFRGARDVAMVQDNVPLLNQLNQLNQPAYGLVTTPEDTWRLLLEVARTVPLPVQALVYLRDQLPSDDLDKTWRSLVNDSMPSELPTSAAALVQLLPDAKASVVALAQLMVKARQDGVDPETLVATVQAHAQPEPILAQLAEQMAQVDEATHIQMRPLVDAWLLRAPAPAQAAWLESTAYELPRTRAKVRLQDLHEQPAIPRAHPRRRS